MWTSLPQRRAARTDKGVTGLEFGLGRFDEDDLAWGNHLDGAHVSLLISGYSISVGLSGH